MCLAHGETPSRSPRETESERGQWLRAQRGGRSSGGSVLDRKIVAGKGIWESECAISVRRIITMATGSRCQLTQLWSEHSPPWWQGCSPQAGQCEASAFWFSSSGRCMAQGRSSNWLTAVTLVIAPLQAVSAGAAVMCSRSDCGVGTEARRSVLRTYYNAPTMKTGMRLSQVSATSHAQSTWAPIRHISGNTRYEKRLFSTGTRALVRWLYRLST